MKYFKSIIFMKVGFHSGENLEAIIKRKRQEEGNAGKIFWGYGGTLCHPLTQVIPFVKESLNKVLKPVLFMSFTSSKSKYVSRVGEAREYSFDNKNWYPLPSGVSVKGSRYAIICKNLLRLDVSVNLNFYEVAIGKNKGKPLGEVIKSRIDKACAFLNPNHSDSPPKMVKILYIAEIVEPFAVILR
jgi:hypothetical protein